MRSTRRWWWALSFLAASGCGDSHGGSGGAGTSSSTTGIGGGEAKGCGKAVLLANPPDTSQPGPWKVGVATVKIGNLTTEIWYPGRAGTEAGNPPVQYDIRAWLPASEMGKISDAKAPMQTCDCYRGMPQDSVHGPYPVVIFVHGTAGFRTQSLELMTHWASRGFIVVAADHPGLMLTDLLGSVCGGPMVTRNLDADLQAIVAALGATDNPDLAFLQGLVDLSHVAMVGHSAGGEEVSKMGDAADVLIPMAADGPTGGARLRSTLVLGAREDKVVAYPNQQMGYVNAPKSKRFVGISPAGHLTFSGLCGIHNADGQDIVTIGKAANVCGLSLADGLFDCSASYLPEDEGLRIVNDATSAVLEETLQCASDRAAWFSGIAGRYPEVVDAEQDL